MLIIVGYFIIELLASIKFGIEIGFGWSVVWVVFTSFLGVALLKLSPYALSSTFNNLAFKKFNPFDAQNAAISYILGSILLIIPGIFSDILGFILILYTLYLNIFAKMPQSQNLYDDFNKNKGDNDVIDVEIIDSNSSSDSNSNSKL